MSPRGMLPCELERHAQGETCEPPNTLRRIAWGLVAFAAVGALLLLAL